ncbi:hypothetical protein DIU31_019455 [Mucilaginibacter rubeus]|uniref:Uncharacterized protein n=1 Tax=Mucilaginibacter rubeus TaxID=2027860 RepID=A0AAE6MJM8_9SPHI|nr:MULTISPECIES: hypothetical protein [Mucilaginibacter]QEM05584.1 hypothetical protein DIU31_019455 [Mucilaginibacter rubeus]QEM18171.1 hypothetical protein DIU38_019655 [Mucilaginibacter gossypii]QTE45296.1 hypothetical protein J3L19_08055 [Mucilaginibacter rubeus]QTE51892.1 hypothetical protein J3L21_08030 [Mucilaginibacter rubeus]QTE56980.1 hypothetical protein J3L23_33265 [Mucilaginibacter rubeus]
MAHQLKHLVVCGLLSLAFFKVQAQVSGYKNFKPAAGVSVMANTANVTVTWPAGVNSKAKLVLNLKNGQPLFTSVQLSKGGIYKPVIENVDPQFILTEGQRDLISQNGWNIFFDKVPLKPHHSYKVNFHKKSINVSGKGTRTVITIPGLEAPNFKGDLEITLYNGQPLFNVAAVVSTQIDSTAILYDAGLVAKTNPVKAVNYSDVYEHLQTNDVNKPDTAKSLAVKYRTIIGANDNAGIAIFPAPHQYFYPLDEAFNLKFVWYGNNYRNLLPGYGLGIRQELQGDKRFVPWFNAPPGTKQRLNFFCLLGNDGADNLLNKVKQFTHNDSYKPLPGYKTMASHFHNEFIMSVVLSGKPVPDSPSFVKVLKRQGINIVHLAEFHYTAHPKGPDEQRLKELKALFDQCNRLSDSNFLLLPGEEPNEFFGGHWLAFFPKPVYWIMSRKAGTPFESTDAEHGKVYHIGDKADMLNLLKAENGLAWTAHARTKGSTGFPDAYKKEDFCLSDRFLGAAWKALPADLSEPRLGKRVFDLMDDMNNWGLKKKILSEADLFSIEPENEMYAHLNVNYLKLAKQPQYTNGWQPVLDALEQGKFFSTTGEVLIEDFTVNGHSSGETIALPADGKCTVNFKTSWTFPLNFAEIISGDGKKVYRERIDLTSTQAFGTKTFNKVLNMKGRKWVRLEVWDAAVDGAYTQTVWLK